MSAPKRLDLAEVRRRLRASKTIAPRAAKSRAVPEDDQALLQAALEGVRALPQLNIGDLKTMPPAAVRRHVPESKEDEAPVTARCDSWIPDSWMDDSPQGFVELTSEQAAMAQAVQGAIRIRTDQVFPECPKPEPLPRQSELDEKAALAESIYAPTSLDLRLEGGDELHYLSNGVPRTVLRDLRRGRWVVQDKIDLHGATRDEARDLLAAFMGQCRKTGVRCVRVVHGKGKGSPGREPVLKRLVAGWLMNYADVMAYCQARLPEGGAGALIVLLKSPRPTRK